MAVTVIERSMSIHEVLAWYREHNPSKRYAARRDGICIGVWRDEAAGFIPCSVEMNPGNWEPMPQGYLTIDGKVPDAPEDWEEA